MGMNISMISTGDKDTSVYYCGLLSTFLIERKSRFQIEVSKIKI